MRSEQVRARSHGPPRPPSSTARPWVAQVLLREAPEPAGEDRVVEEAEGLQVAERRVGEERRVDAVVPLRELRADPVHHGGLVRRPADEKNPAHGDPPGRGVSSGRPRGRMKAGSTRCEASRTGRPSRRLALAFTRAQRDGPILISATSPLLLPRAGAPQAPAPFFLRRGPIRVFTGRSPGRHGNCSRRRESRGLESKGGRPDEVHPLHRPRSCHGGPRGVSRGPGAIDPDPDHAARQGTVPPAPELRHPCRGDRPRTRRTR